MTNRIISDKDRHLSPPAYCALAGLAGVIGLSASYVTIKLFALAIQATEPEGSARELLTLAATLFVVAELAACFLVGLLPVRRLRALRWQLSACALALVAFEAVSLYGARVVLLQTADAQVGSVRVQADQLRASIEANRRSADALLAAGQHSSQSVIASSRADGARSIRDAAALEGEARRLAAELARLEAERKPTARGVFGESGVIALAVAQSLLMSCIGLLFLGAAGALVRAARDAASTAAPMHPDAVVDAPLAMTDAPDAVPVAAPQSQGLPRGAIAAVLPSWGRYALVAGAGLATLGAAQAAPQQIHAAAPADAPQAATDAPIDAPQAVIDAPADASGDDAARFLRVKAGIEAGRIKPSLRAIYAAEGASQQVARRYLGQLLADGVIVDQGRGRGYRLAQAGRLASKSPASHLEAVTSRQAG